MGGDLPDKLLGVREGFRRYFSNAREGLERSGLDWSISVSVIPQPQDEAATPLPLSDAATLELARKRARELAEQGGDHYGFYVGSEAGLLDFEVDGQRRYFVRSWSVVIGLGEEAWGSSGSVQLPARLIDGLDGEEIPFAVPGRRRSGGMVSSLTGGAENRRSATALATFHALSSLLYGWIESRPRQRRTAPFRGRI